MAKSYLAQPSVYRLPVIIEMIADGQLLIPRFQRPFVWKDEQRIDLLDSIMRGMPIGSLLAWRTFEHMLETYDRLGPYKVGQPKEGQGRLYLLDGHQRLSSLYGAFKEPVQSEIDENNEVDAQNRRLVRWPIYADLQTQEISFRILPRNWVKQPRITFLPVWKFLSPLALYEHQKKLLDEGFKDVARRAEDLSSQFKDYQIPVIPLVTEDLEQVTQSFQRVNSQGTSMSEVHMINALMWTREFDLNERLKGATEQLVDVGWGMIEPQTLLDVIKVGKDIDVYRAQPKIIKNALRQDQNALDDLVENVRAAARFLAKFCGVKGPAILPYKYQVILLAEAARVTGGELKGELAKKLERWFWRTTYGEYFTGMTGSQIRRATDHVRALATGTLNEFPEDLRIDVEPFRKFEFNSVRGRAFVLLLARQAAVGNNNKSSRSGELVAEAGSEVVPKILTNQFTPSDVKDRQLVDGAENRWIVAPTRSAALLSQIQKRLGSGQYPSILESHAIPARAADALLQGRYKDFLVLRRHHLVALERQFVEGFGLSYRVPSEGADIGGVTLE